MAIVGTRIDAFEPRGAAPGDNVTATGVMFGIAEGEVIFDPLGEDLAATVVSWEDDEIVFTVPALSERDRHYVVQIRREDETDANSMTFWVPSADPMNNALSHQLPYYEEGVDQDTDDPTKIQAADFNRMIDRLQEAGAPDLSGYQQTAQKGQASGYASLDGAGTVPLAQLPAGVATDAEVAAAVSAGVAAGIATHVALSDPHTQYQKESEKGQASGYAGLDADGKVPAAQLPDAGMGTVEREFCPVTTQGQTAFTLADALPGDVDVTKAYLIINTARYHYGFFTISGTTLTWGGAFTLVPDRHDVRLYY